MALPCILWTRDLNQNLAACSAAHLAVVINQGHQAADSVQNPQDRARKLLPCSDSLLCDLGLCCGWHLLEQTSLVHLVIMLMGRI